MFKKIFLPLWILGAFLLFLYSYTQVDLSLTLSQASVFQSVQKWFQYIGWFNRPLSTYLYVGTMLYLFVLYIFTVQQGLKNNLSRRMVWLGILLVTAFLTVSYNAFSYDLFNYIFDAKIITHYHQNPYLHKALDFPADPMLSFMRWTHRLYPYGPVWLLLSAPISFVGSQIFIVTFFLFKIFISLTFLLTVWSIEKIAKTLKLQNILIPLIVFAFNPLVLLESVVSSHNDISMMGFGMLGMWLLLSGKNVFGGLTLLVSAGIKFVTILLLPAYFFLLIFKRKNYMLLSMLILMIGGVMVATLRTNFQPWYLLYPAPFAALLFHNKLTKLPLYIVTVAGIFYYVPSLYTGNWDQPIPQILNGIVIGAIVVCLVSILVQLQRKHV